MKTQLRFFRYIIVIALALCGHALTYASTGTELRPNILLIVADDLGYSDIGSYGSEIATPHLDTLANRGFRFSNFSVAVTCSTTRSMLMTGVDNHLNGLGGLDVSGVPRKESTSGYEGHLNARVRTFVSILKEGGYHTYMSGKWHLGYSLETGPEQHGFESMFVLPGGAASHFSDRSVVSVRDRVTYRENGKAASLPNDFYSSSYFTDKLIEYIESNRADGKPFFAYASYTAPHWPLQAPEEFIERYKGVYDKGYEEIRAKRLHRLQASGLIPPVSGQPGLSFKQRSWDSLDDTQKAREIRHMQVYAAMVEALDHNIGRLLEYLDGTGELENTVVIFLSDNGPEGNDPYVIEDGESSIPQKWKTDTASLGGPGTFSSYGPGWAGVSATPFRLYKAFPAEGGIRVPAIFVIPDTERAEGEIVHEFASVLDITPTILEIAGLEHPAMTEPGSLHRPQGTSLLGHFHDGNKGTAFTGRTVGWELLGRKAIRNGDWKLTWIDKPYGKGDWALYNLSTDPGESTDLAQRDPSRFEFMLNLWKQYAAENNVIDHDYSALQYGKENRHYER